MTTFEATLRELLEKATPGPWFHKHELGMDDSDINTVYRRATLPEQKEAGFALEGKAIAGPPIYRNADARIIALAPDLARLCLEQHEALKQLLQDDDLPVHWPDCECRGAALSGVLVLPLPPSRRWGSGMDESTDVLVERVRSGLRQGQRAMNELIGLMRT